MASSTATPAETAAGEVQTLLRFLSQDARVPLATALSKINDLRKAQLNTPEAISRSNALADLKPIFSGDEKLAKQILAAAKRISNPNSKKRASDSGDGGDASASKRARGGQQRKTRGDGYGLQQIQSPAELEASLALPISTLSISELQAITIQTNRAPLLLAFAVTLLKYTMPEQPLSSRLSLAQAVVSMNSRTKARSIGLAGMGGKSAEEEGLGDGQPKVRVMGREVPVMRRSGYFVDAGVERGLGGGGGGGHTNEGTYDDTAGRQPSIKGGEAAEKQDPNPNSPHPNQGEEHHHQHETPLWALDLEALKNLHTTAPTPPTPRSTRHPPTSHLPIHTPQSAHSYLLKSFTLTSTQTKLPPSPSSPPKPHPRQKASSSSSQAAALSHLLQSLDLLFSSWAVAAADADASGGGGRGNDDDLDSRAWRSYLRVRPDVVGGVGGWGQRGEVGLGAILGERRGGAGGVGG